MDGFRGSGHCHGGTKEGYPLQPGKFRTGLSGCDFGFGGLEVTVPDFELLVSSWENEIGGSVPPNAVIGGCEAPPPPINGKLGTGCGASLFYCRATISGLGLHSGKVRPGFSGCHVSYNGQERVEFSYQVLVYNVTTPMPLTTISASSGTVPLGAIRGGTDSNGLTLYVCAASYAGGLHPGKVRTGLGGCLIPYGGGEITVSNYEVLVPNWYRTSAPSYLPSFDFPTGTDGYGNPLYTCRGYFAGGIHPGSAGRWAPCNFGWGNREQTQATGFDILTTSFLNPK